VGLAPFHDRVVQRVQARGGRRQWNEIVRRLRTLEAQGGTAADHALRDVAVRLRRRGLVILISDLLVSPESTRTALKFLRHHGHEVLVFHLMDPTAQREMAQRNAMDKITSQALDVLDKRTDELAAGVAGELAEAWCDHLLLELDVMRRSALRLPETIDARALDSLEEAARKSKPSKNGKEQERIYPVETEAGFLAGKQEAPK